MASYLMFEAPYTQELMALGETDTMNRRDEVAQFFGWDRRHKPRGPDHPQAQYSRAERVELGGEEHEVGSASSSELDDHRCPERA